MNFKKIIIIFVAMFSLYSCADYQIDKQKEKKEKIYYSSSGFALIYEDNYYENKTINKKLNNEELGVLHNFLKVNTPIKIINPENSKVVETKIIKKANFPKIFNIVITKKIASLLELDEDNPYIEIIEVKKNKTFIAKVSNTFEEEKNVSEKAPVDEVQMNDLTEVKITTTEKSVKKENFILVINDFYYVATANNLRKELIKKTGTSNISVKKIGNNKYRLLAGPFVNFNALKITYISLNNLGFENLDIYRE